MYLKQVTGYSKNDCSPKGFISKFGSLGFGRDTGILWSFRINMTNFVRVSVLLENWWSSVRAWGFSTLTGKDVKVFVFVMEIKAEKSEFT